MRAALIVMVELLIAASGVAQSAQQSDAAYPMPIDGFRLYEASVQRLLGNKWGHGTMIYQSGGSNKNDFAVSVWGADNKPKTLTLLRFAPKDPWHAKTKSEIDVPIDSDFADAIQKAWCALLLKTRYPPKIPVYADADEVEFSASCAGGAFGHGCPVSGFQKELTDFGFELRDYCMASEAERKAKRDSLIPRLEEFATRVTQSHLY